MSTWRQVPAPANVSSIIGLRVWQKNVEDGHLSVMVATEGGSWHLSISHRTNENPPKPGRLPTYEEIKEARYLFCPDKVYMALIFPPMSEFVNDHPTTMHLWEVA